jgi:hypothetical protein
VTSIGIGGLGLHFPGPTIGRLQRTGPECEICLEVPVIVLIGYLFSTAFGDDRCPDVEASKVEILVDFEVVFTTYLGGDEIRLIETKKAYIIARTH